MKTIGNWARMAASLAVVVTVSSSSPSKAVSVKEPTTPGLDGSSLSCSNANAFYNWMISATGGGCQPLPPPSSGSYSPVGSCSHPQSASAACTQCSKICQSGGSDMYDVFGRTL